MLIQALSRRLGTAIASASSRSWQHARCTTTIPTDSAPSSSTSPPPPPSPSSLTADDVFSHRTQHAPTYTMPYYGASDEELASLTDEKAKQVLQLYGGLIRKDDTPSDWRSRLRNLTRAWHLPKQLTIAGVVVSNKMDKSVVIATRRRRFHSKYYKFYYRTRRFMAHDELNLCREGDHVIIRSCRPLSKRKAHVVVQNFGDKMRSGADERKIVLDNMD